MYIIMYINGNRAHGPHPRSRPEKLGRVGERARLRLPDPEPALRRLPQEALGREAARRRRHRRADPRPRRARPEDRPDAERPRLARTGSLEEIAEGAIE